MICCVVFDFDGTLVASNEIKRRTFLEIARPWDPQGEVVAAMLERWPAADRFEKTRKIAECLIAEGLLPAESSAAGWASRLAREYTAQCERAIAACPEVSGATAALEELSGRGLRLYINSATPTESLRRLLKLRAWDRLFRAVYGSECSKAANLARIGREAGAGRNEIVQVGDGADDRSAAEQAGCHFVAVAACGGEACGTAGIPAVRDLRELIDLLPKLSGAQT